MLQGYCVVQGPEEIKKEIIAHGPVIAPMTPYTDFLAYKEGTYFPSETAFKFNGQQALKIVGWEKSMQGDVWIVENSWGPEWGEDGYAKVMAGHKDLGLDFIGIAPQPVSMPFSEYEEMLAKWQSEVENAENTNIAGGDDTEEVTVE